MTTACGLTCEVCPAASPCGKVCNFCMAGRHRAHGENAGCARCDTNPLLRMDIRRAVIDELGGLDFVWPRPVQHLQVGDLPLHLPVLVQAYAAKIDLPWVALPAGQVLGVPGPGWLPQTPTPRPPQNRLMVETPINTGLQWDELIALKPRHLDLLKRNLTVEETIVEVSTKNSPTGARMLTKPYPKDNEPRTMAVPEDLVIQLADWITGR